MSGNYDIQQVCENGHQITGCYNIEVEKRQKYCQKCGAPTIIKCPDCGEEIQGDPLGESITGESHSLESTKVPSYCRNCGNSYPWTKSKIVAAIQILTEFGELDEKEKETIEQDINNVARDIPQAELSAMRIKQIWGKCSRAGYEIIMEFASRTAAKVLKNP